MKPITDDYRLGVGFYTIPQAARIVGEHPNKLRRWLGETRAGESVINRDDFGRGTVTFMELMEVMFVQMFRKEGVSLQAIRKAVDAAARKFKAKHPFAVKRFDTDGKTIFATLKSNTEEKELVEDLARGQLCFQSIIKPFFRKIEYRDDTEAMRFWPLNRNGRVVLDPLRRFGQPIDAETGVPTATLVNAVKVGGGHDVHTVARWFDVPLEAVKAAISFENSLAS